MAKQEAIVIQPLNMQTLFLPIEFDTPLISHKFAEKARKQMLGKQMGKAQKMKRENRNPEQEYEDALYRFDDDKLGYPADAFKGCGVGACRYVQGLPMTMAKGVFYVHGKYSAKEKRELVAIEGKIEKREDVVWLQNGVPQTAFRPQIMNAKAILQIEYNADILSAEQIVNLFNIAGNAVGVGDWRPGSGKGGSFGRFHVVAEKTKKKMV